MIRSHSIGCCGKVFLTSHYGTVSNSSELVAYNDFALQYPHRYRAYPRVFVAIDKHANYKSDTACDEGAAFTDDCPNNQDESARVPVIESRNLGSSVVKWSTTTTSQSPGYYAGSEYFWNSNFNFCGWFLGVTECAGSYGLHLHGQGF